MRNLSIFLLLGFILIPLVSSYTYNYTQEFANSTECTGTSWIANSCDLMIDGNYSTYVSVPNGEWNYLYQNYTIPDYMASASWQLLYTSCIGCDNIDCSTPVAIHSGCLNGSVLMTLMRFNGFHTTSPDFECYDWDALVWRTVWNGCPDGGCYGDQYEDAIIWNIYGSCYQEFANASESCGGSSEGYEYPLTSLLTNDGDWSTGANGGSSMMSGMVVDYIKPTGSTDDTRLIYGVDGVNNVSVRIPQSCWDYDPVHLYFSFRMYDGEIRCYDGTGTWPGMGYEVPDNYYYGQIWSWTWKSIVDGLGRNLYENGVLWVGDMCVPSWKCAGYGACQQSNTRSCIATYDENTCGFGSYHGDMSEFIQQCVSQVQSGNDVVFQSSSTNLAAVTDLMILQGNAVTPLTIDFSGNSIDFSGGLAPGVVSIINNKITINSDIAPNLDVPARITVYHVSPGYHIYKDGVECGDPNCTLISYNRYSEKLVFDVLGFSTYVIGSYNKADLSKIVIDGVGTMGASFVDIAELLVIALILFLVVGMIVKLKENFK
jgi:hypothetical protein